ncbi:MAG: dockerin type I domain-containing protein [Planctomycetota bacterium]
MYARGLRSVAIPALAALVLLVGIGPASANTVDWVQPTCGTGTVSGSYDLAYDTADDTLWVIDQGDGIICHYGLSPFPPEISFIASISHPFGPATFPLLTPVCRGLAYNPVSDTLVVLNSSTSQIQQILKDGTIAGSAVTLTASGTSPGTFHGLAWDTLTNTIWARDVANNALRNFDPLTGNEIGMIPVPQPLGDVFFGDSIHFVDEGGVGYLEMSYGDIFSGGVTRTLRMDMAGNEVGIEVDLTAPGEPILGTIRSPGGSTFYCTSGANVYKMTCPAPSLIPPTGLFARADNNGNIQLEWTNHGPLAGGDYDSIEVTRSGEVVLAAGAGSTTSFFDTTVIDGTTVTYTVTATSGLDSASASLDVRTGAGALVDHAQFDGAKIYDIAFNPTSGTLLVSEFTAGGVNGRIFEYDTDLNLVSTLQLTVSQVRGIAYNDVQDEILLTRAGSANITRVDPTTGAVISLFTTGLSTNLGCLSYDPLANAYLVQDLDTGALSSLDAAPATLGQNVFTCSPPIITGTQFAAGVTVLPPDLQAPEGYFLAPVSDGSDFTVQANQFFLTSCFPTEFSVPFESLGATVTQNTNSVRGIEDVGNILFICNEATNTIFKMLLAPGGNNFIRGDANQDLTVDAADALYIVDYLYSGGVEPTCFDATDANDDGRVDLSDTLYIIFYLFQPTGLPSAPFPEPPAPFPAEGPDPTFVDALGC